jgi:hypothetical protein
MSDFPSRPRKGLRRARAACLGAAVACAVAAATTGSAQAQTSMTLDHGVMDLGAFPGVEIVTPASPISVAVTPDTETVFHVSPGGFQFPHFTGTQSGITIELDVVLATTLTGTFDPTTGAMTTDPASFDVTIDLDTPLGTSTCVMDVAQGNPVPMSFSTEATSPYPGDRFDPAPLSDPLVNGAIVTSWTDLPASTFTSGTTNLCTFLDAQKAGPGGVWLSNGIAPPTTPSPPPPSGGGAISTPVPTVTPPPKKKKCKKGFKKVKVHGKVKCKKKKRK